MTVLQEAERLLPKLTRAGKTLLAQRLSPNNILKITRATSTPVSDQVSHL